jgi:anti-anti-sigma regulatory factor
MTDTLRLPFKPLTLMKRHAVRFDTRWTMSSLAIVSAYRDVAASNASALTDYALVNAVRCRGLILDLSGLEFFGAEGFSALHTVSVHCARAEIGWIVVPGAAASRLIRICDPHGSLPTVGTVSAALPNLQDQRFAAQLPSRRRRSASRRLMRVGSGVRDHPGPMKQGVSDV